jgi:large subunit ribosomal protein L4
METKIFDIKGKETSKKVNLNDSVFGIEPNDHAIYLDVKLYLANQRQGTSKSKERNEVSGTTKKFKRQKGTGGARAGSMKSPVFVGGGRVFGPKPRDYSFKLNKKLKDLARCSALSYKVKNNAFKVVEDFGFDTPKTKEFAEILKNFNMADKKTLVVLADQNKNVYLSSRNLSHSKVVTASQLNTYDVLNAKNVLFMEGSIKQIDNLLQAK